MVGFLVLGLSPFHAQTSICPVAMVGLCDPTISPMRGKSKRLASFFALGQPIGPVTCPFSILAMAGIVGQRDEKDGAEALEIAPCNGLSPCQKVHACQAKVVVASEVASLRTTKDHVSSDGQVVKISDRLVAIGASRVAKSPIVGLVESREMGRCLSAAPNVLQVHVAVFVSVVVVV